MKVEIRGKTFKIDLINNYVDQVYAELYEKTFKLTELQDKVVELARERAESLKSGDVKEINKKFNNNVNEIDVERKQLAKDLIELREEIVKELLESNEYDYDKKWWLRKTSADDINEFMLTCMGRNSKDKKKESRIKI